MNDFDSLRQFATHLSQLSELPRTGWFFEGVRDPESIADHSFGVVAIALWICDQLRDVDVEATLRMAILHDIAEAVVTDIPGPVKSKLGDSVRENEHRIGMEIANAAAPGWGTWLQRYKDGDCVESQIVKAADRLQMLLQAERYEATQHGEVSRFFEGVDPLFADERLNALFRAFRETRSFDRR